MTGATGNVYVGLHEFADMALLLHYFGSGGGLFLDVGANVGSYTVLAAKVRHANVISLEPVPRTFAKLQRNILVNEIASRVEAHQLAAGSAAGELRFSADLDTTNRPVDREYRGESVVVPVRPLNELLADRTAQFWKIDVEGFESQVLAGSSSALANPGVEVVLLEAGGAHVERTMRRYGFELCNYDPWRREISAASAVSSGGNHLWIRGTTTVEARCRAAAPVSVCGFQV